MQDLVGYVFIQRIAEVSAFDAVLEPKHLGTWSM